MGQYLIGNKRVELDIPQPEAPPPDASAGVDKSDMCSDMERVRAEINQQKPPRQTKEFNPVAFAELQSHADADPAISVAQRVLRTVKETFQKAAVRNVTQDEMDTFKANAAAAVVDSYNGTLSDVTIPTHEGVIDRQRRKYLDSLGSETGRLARMTETNDRYGGMSDAELRQEVEHYTGNDQNLMLDPQVVNALSRELRERGLAKEHAHMRAAAQERHADEPWLNSPAGALAYKRLEAHRKRSLDTTAILFDGADAKPYGISLLSVFDWTGWAEEARRADAPKIDRSVADWKPIPSLINRQ